MLTRAIQIIAFLGLAGAFLVPWWLLLLHIGIPGWVIALGVLLFAKDCVFGRRP